MNNQSAVAVLLQECERALDTLPAAKAGPGEPEEREYRRCQALLPEDLRSLLEEAKEMKWPLCRRGGNTNKTSAQKTKQTCKI